MALIQGVTKDNCEDAGLVYAKSWQASHKGIVDDDSLALRTPEYKTLYLENELNNKSIALYLIYDSKIPAGIISLNIDEGEIKALYVSPDYWGKGYGKVLLDVGITKLSNFESVFLIVMNKNKRAQAFYKKHGFINTGEEQVLSAERGISTLKFTYQMA